MNDEEFRNDALADWERELFAEHWRESVSSDLTPRSPQCACSCIRCGPVNAHDCDTRACIPEA